MLRHRPRLSRREILIAGAGLTVAVMTAACQGQPQDTAQVDELQSQLDLADRDATDLTAAAAADSARATSLLAGATIRKAHAAALTKELQRVAGSTTTPPATSTTSTAAASAPSLDQVREQLRFSAKSAADVAIKESGYRAGLLASISAACASTAEVDLA